VSFYRSTPEMRAVGDAVKRAIDDHLARNGAPADRYAMIIAVEGASDGSDSAPLVGYGLREDLEVYPCSLVKLFHLVAAEHALAEGRLKPHDELSRALDDMIRWSSNTATNYVIDLLTGTTGDTLLDEAEMADWIHKRLALNRFFDGWGWEEFVGLNLSQKLMDDQRYGREHAFLSGPHGAHNRLSPRAVGRLMHRIMSDRLPALAGRAAMMRRLERDPQAPDRAIKAYQVDGYLGAGLPGDAVFWSKAGHNQWTGDPAASFYRHDVLWAALDEDRRLLLTVFTESEAVSERDDVLPFAAAKIWEALH